MLEDNNILLFNVTTIPTAGKTAPNTQRQANLEAAVDREKKDLCISRMPGVIQHVVSPNVLSI